MTKRTRLAIEASLATTVVVAIALALNSSARSPVIAIGADSPTGYVYYTEFNAHPYAPITPENIRTQCLAFGPLASEQLQELAGLLNHSQQSGRFEWFQTRLCLTVSCRSRLFVDSAGGFFDTESGMSGRLRAVDFRSLDSFMARFRSAERR